MNRTFFYITFFLLSLFLSFILPFSVMSIDFMKDASDIKDVSKQNMESLIESANEMVKGFQDSKVFENDRDILRLEKETNKLYDKLISSDKQKNELKETEFLCSKDGSSNEFLNTYLFFISFSMPKKSIEKAIVDAIKNNLSVSACEKVVLVVRGMKDNNMKESLKFMYEIMKNNSIRTDMPVQMNPELFEKYAVSKVPSLIYDDGKSIKKISGDRGIKYLIDNIDKYNNESVGVVYPIMEKDIRHVMRDALEKSIKHAQERIPEIIKSASKFNKYKDRLLKVSEEKTYKVDMSFTLQDDLIAIDKTIVPKGTIFNPASLLKLPGEIIFIDAEDPRQLDYAMNNNFYKVIITNGDLYYIAQKYKKKVYVANDIVLSRFAITRVPSIVKQVGREIYVTQKKID